MTKPNQLLSECPAWTHNTKDAPEGVPKWSGSASPPWLGDKVNVTMNSLGPGTVRGFFVQHGFLGVGVELESPPEWYTKQNNGNPTARVYGAEVTKQNEPWPKTPREMAAIAIIKRTPHSDAPISDDTTQTN